MKLLLLLLVALSLLPVHSQRLFMAKYIHSSTNRALEIYNPSCSSAVLSEFAVIQAFNGQEFTHSPSSLITLSGSLASQSSAVICNTAFNGACTVISALLTFTGDDAVALIHNNVVIDIIGDER